MAYSHGLPYYNYLRPVILPDLLEVLNLEQLEDRLFRGMSHATLDAWLFYFGGRHHQAHRV
jgi:hypothetical protein